MCVQLDRKPPRLIGSSRLVTTATPLPVVNLNPNDPLTMSSAMSGKRARSPGRRLPGERHRTTGLDRGEDLRDERQDMRQTVPRAAEDYSSDSEPRQILLMRQALIGRHDHAEAGGDGGAQKNTIPKTTPAPVPDGSDVVSP